MKKTLCALIVVIGLGLSFTPHCFAQIVGVEDVTVVQIRVKGSAFVDLGPGMRAFDELKAWISTNQDGWSLYEAPLPEPELWIWTEPFSLAVARNAIFLIQDRKKAMVRELNQEEILFFKSLTSTGT